MHLVAFRAAGSPTHKPTPTPTAITYVQSNYATLHPTATRCRSNTLEPRHAFCGGMEQMAFECFSFRLIKEDGAHLIAITEKLESTRNAR